MPRYKKLHTSRGFLCTCVPLVPGDSMSAPAARKAVTTLYEFVWMRASWGTLCYNYISRIFCFQDISDAQLLVRQAHRNLIFRKLVVPSSAFSLSQNPKMLVQKWFLCKLLAAAWLSQVVYANFRLVLNSIVDCSIFRLFSTRAIHRSFPLLPATAPLPPPPPYPTPT
jgi:hypothetical protein